MEGKKELDDGRLSLMANTLNGMLEPTHSNKQIVKKMIYPI